MFFGFCGVFFVFLWYWLLLLFHFLFCLFGPFLFFSWWAWLEVCRFCLSFQKSSPWFYWSFLFLSLFYLFPSDLSQRTDFGIFLVLLFLILSLFLFFWDFSCSLRKAWIAVYFPLRTALAASHRFWKVVFSLSFVLRYFLISSLISSLTHWFIGSMLFSLHVFVLYPFFFLWLISSFITLW